ncbi:MAG: histidinol-phosphatase HisJ family protein [Lachnospiraceae bacterium]|nr:histidinol-phosphatase HisJ family protein [Lachnospiraceae bacterium]
MLADYHMHTEFSSDSNEPVENMIKRSIESGIKNICITDHYDLDYPHDPEEDDFVFDTDKYFVQLNELKDKYKDKINLHIGVELGLQPHLMDRLRTYTNKYPFDFVIGSSHLVHGIDPYYPAFFEGRSYHEALMEYFESISENLDVFDDFDVYGHIDYVIRYVPGEKPVLNYSEFGDILDSILERIIEKGHGIELNTAGFYHNTDHPNPHEDVIRRYRQLGGDIITIGADAHGTQHIGYGFNKARDILLDCGFSYYTIFENRQPVYKSI